MENRKVRIDNREQENEKQGQEDFVAIAVDIQVPLSIGLPPNGLTAATERVLADWPGCPLASILDDPSLFFDLHISETISCNPKGMLQLRKEHRAMSFHWIGVCAFGYKSIMF